MDVFGFALAAGLEFFRDAAIDAAYELDVFERLPSTFAGCTHRMRALLDVLVAMGVLVRDGERYARGDVPPRPVVARAGWGLMADVIRRDRPLPVEGGAVELRYHAHLAQVGAPAARELVALLIAPDRPAGSLLDLGAGAGTYAAAWLGAAPATRATVVDFPEVIALAKRALAPFGHRVQLVASEIRGADAGVHDVVLLANVLHLHDPDTCAQLVAAAARAAKPGGRVVIKDLRVDDGRRGPFEGLAFALNMAIYTGGGDVYETSRLRAWMEQAGLVGIQDHRLASQPDGIVLVGRRPRGARATFEATTGLVVEPAGDAAMPPSFRTMLAHAMAHAGGADADALRTHYTEVMPRLRAEMLEAELFRVPLDWARLPRLSAIRTRLAALAGVAVPAADTLGELYERTHYGGFMPLLYGYPADLAYFTRRGRELGLDTLGTIDRYLAAPILHELCHFARGRDALLPPHLDECIAGWIGVHVWPELAYPEGDHDDAIYAAPWLAQVGQAVARAFGVDAVVRAHAGHAPWDAALPPSFVDAATRFGWEDWCRRRTQHFLSDTFDPDPWLALVWDAIAARPDPDFDRAIVRDALRAMCLTSALVDGSFRTRTALPAGPIAIDARACRVTAPVRGEVDRVAPRYWLPPAVGARLVARGLAEQHVELASLADVDRIADALVQ